MLTRKERERYSRQTMLPEIGDAGQQLLKEARVLVVGAGGLGCPILQYLAAAGVGTLGIVDGDVVSLSNLQRQVLYSVNDLGISKAKRAAEVITRLNPDIHLLSYPVFITNENVLQLASDYDIIVDGTDNFDTRYLLNDACVMKNKPLVSGAIFRFEGQVSVFNYKGGPTYRCLFPTPPGAGESPSCAEIGVVATLPGIVGTIQANEVIKMITGAGEALSGRLLVIDALTMQSHTFSFKANEANRNIKELPKPSAITCEVPVPELSIDELQRRVAAGARLVDVRELHEHEFGNIGGVNLPLSRLSDRYGELSLNDDLVLYCASGKRSLNAANFLMAKGYNVSHLAGGLAVVKVSQL
ncbi:MAG: HesA/MoeB/ThiF family protein [Taibaiella sp.]|nr:HesA/MoeB/ThiF family protein [Taibaiella sp.]